MAKNVFILGAGTSFDAGAPLMNSFLDVAEDMLITGEANQYRDAYKTVFNLISELQILHSKSYLNLYNIESLFGAIEMGSIINN